MRTVLFKRNQRLKLYILSVYYMFEQFSSFSKLCIPFLISASLYPPKFVIFFSIDEKVSSIIFDVYFDL